MTALATTTNHDDVERWLEWASAGDIIRWSRFPKMHYGLLPASMTRTELLRMETLLNYSDILFICGLKRGYVVMSEEMFNDLTSEKKKTLEDDDD